jgi:hypothetical protein
MSPASSFAHRTNHDETFDSICRICYTTVATHFRETGLEQSEQEHVCESRLLERFQAIRAEAGRER